MDSPHRRAFVSSIFLRTAVVFAFVALVTDRLDASAESLRLSSRVVTTRYGSLRGFIATIPTKSLQPVEIFLGVPYASPPVGSLRFMPPVTPPHWRGVRVADRFGPVCPQRFPDISNETEAMRRMPAGRVEYLRRLTPYLKNQSEDCLYLNIYAPAVVGRDPIKLPVLVFIHGESYEWNSGNPYDGRVLASFGNIVVITLNYRLGVLGFLPAIDGSAKGNYGLMDQVAALHWIQENINEFGGDAKNVTVVGQGHGAACVHLLMLSQMAKGLFNRAIMQSGSALSPWAIAREAVTYARHLARVLGCPTQHNSAMVECLRQQPVADIMRVRLVVPQHLTAFGPTIDGIVVHKDPEILLKTQKGLYGQYDLMIGVTRIESYFQFSAEEEKHGIGPERRDRLLRTLVRNLYSYHLREIFLTIVNEYTDWTRPVLHPISIFDGVADALGDALIVAPLVRAANRHAEVNTKTFFYAFLHQPENGEYSSRLGCIHGEELAYVFGAPLVGTLGQYSHNYTRSEIALSEAVMTYWSNYAKESNPNLPHQEGDDPPEKGRGRYERFTWPQYDAVNQKYLAINTKPKVRDHYHAHRLSFWLHLIPSLHQSGGTHVTLQHHLLDDHDNPLTYDGIVRQVALSSSSGMTTTVSPQLDSVLLSTDDFQYWTTLAPLSGFPGPTSQILSTGQGLANKTDSSAAIMMEQSGYSTALSVTIAVGCSLLVLNVLIFAGVYYQRDKKRSETKLQKRNYQNQQLSCDGASQDAMIIPSKQYPIRAPPPSPAGQLQEFPMTPSFVAQTLNSLPPKVPPKPNGAQLHANCVPEAQPLLPQMGVLKQSAQQRGGADTEEMRVYRKGQHQEGRQETSV